MGLLGSWGELAGWRQKAKSGRHSPTHTNMYEFCSTVSECHGIFGQYLCHMERLINVYA
jgi:hypothetical protein